MSNPITSYMGLHADALPLREQRMKLIASNLANADTPGYKAQDIDFGAALDAARLRPLYPRWDDFAALRAELDTSGLFGSPAIDRVLGAVGSASQ